ncbi:hypothetical protein CBL_01861 [Carabus blaptoides fortunei]
MEVIQGNDESADSEKENATKTNGKPMNENVDAENTENKTKTMRLRTRPCTENDNKSEDSAKINNKSDDGIGRNVGKRRGESTTQDEKNEIESTRKRSTDSQNDTTPKKRRISARVNSESKSSSEENLKRTSRKNERSSNSIEKSDIDSTPVQSKKSRNTEDISTPKILRSNFRLSLKTNTAKKGKQIASHSNGIDKKLKHLNTVNRETRKKNMYLSYNAVTDQRIMFEIPYILCTPYEKESFITNKTKDISSEVNQSFKETSLSSEKNMNTRKGLKNKGKYTTPSSGTTPRQTNKRQTRLKNANQKKEILIIEVSSTDDEASALIESKMAKLSASTDKSTAKNKFKCTVCNQHFSTYYKMRLHKVKHDKSPSSTQTSQNSENMETSEDSDKNTEDNNTETDEESDNGEQVSSVDSEENNVESLDQHNTNIDSETNETDENTEDTNKINENTEGTKINGETSIIHEDIEKSDKKLDTDKNVSEEISEEQSIDKDVVSTTTDEHDIVEISGKQASERQSSNDDAINTADNVEEKNNDEINHENTNTDAANETDDNKLTGSDKSHNEQSDTEGTILNENSAEQITNDIIEGICEFTNMTKTQESEEISVQDKAWEENANSIELTEENAELIQTNSIVQDTNNAVDELNKKQNDENQEDDSSNHEEKNKIQEEVLISTKEIISEISTTSSQDDETIQRNLNVIEIIDDESSQTTTTCSESAIDDINDLNPDILIITDKKNVSTNNISVEQSGLTEQKSEVESLKRLQLRKNVARSQMESFQWQIILNKKKSFKILP